YAFISDAGTIAGHLSLLSGIVPESVLDLLKNEVMRIAEKSDGRLTLEFVLGFGVALWSANAGMKAIFDALNIIYGEEERRGLVWLNVESLLFTFCAIGGWLLATGAIVVFPLVLVAWGVSAIDDPMIGLLRWPFLFALIIVSLAALYRFGPSRRPA